MLITRVKTTSRHPHNLILCFICLVCVSLCLIGQTLDWQRKRTRNKRKSSVSLNGKLLEPRWRFLFFFFFFFSPFLFSFAIFVGSICIFQKSTKENSPGAEMADLHIEDSTEGEEWEREEGRGRKSTRNWFEDDLKETIMSISWRCRAYYAGLIAAFTSAETDYLLGCQAVWRRASERGQGEKCAS